MLTVSVYILFSPSKQAYVQLISLEEQTLYVSKPILPH